MIKKSGALFLIISMLMVLLSGCAKKPATIKGTVTDEDGEPLGGAAIFSVPQRYSTLTDTLGNFSLEGVEPGQYSLLAKLGDDSTLATVGLVEPGQILVTTIVIKKQPPPSPPPPSGGAGPGRGPSCR